MKKNNYILVIYSIVLSIYFNPFVYGQQTPVFSEYNYNTFIINPAYAGFNPSTEITLSSSGFLNQFDGSPKTSSLSISSRLKSENIGLGLGIFRDEIGVTSNTSIYGAYSYKIYFDSKRDRPSWEVYTPHVISFGITAGVQLFRDNLLELGIDNDENFNENINATIPTIGLGFLWNKEQFYLGISTPNIIGDLFASDDQIKIENIYYGYLGSRIYTNRFQEIILKPNILVKYQNGTPLQVDFNTAVNYKNKFELGIGYRTTSSINFLVGFYVFDNWRMIYNYNQAINNSLINSTHGIVLNYRFGRGFKESH